jgi:SAM-dependent methyltransferase
VGDLIPFADYLRAKAPLDERSLNRDVRAELVRQLQGRPELRALDLGTGTGAMLRRLIAWRLAERMVLTGLDQQADVLDQGVELTKYVLVGRGFDVPTEPPPWRAERGGQSVDLTLHCATLAEFRAVDAPFDLITAHAFLDLVPLEPTVKQIRGWLKPGGLVYATLNYDGGTHLFPVYGNGIFEACLLNAYDESMDLRRVKGQPTGGSRAGTRLHSALMMGGFEILSYGSSDWNMTPRNGTHRDEDALCLQAILECIHGEGAANPSIDQEVLKDWLACRLDQLQVGQLGMIVHQLDLLARLPLPSAVHPLDG